jgi:hypothetical protein
MLIVKKNAFFKCCAGDNGSVEPVGYPTLIST